MTISLRSWYSNDVIVAPPSPSPQF